MVEEKMLKAWLKVSSDIKENRLLKELCKKTNMLKSLFIVSNDIEDKRLKNISLNEKRPPLM